ncbi:MAG: iron ABC transporter permease [Myxococcales bacterium]|nr:iron ABC transporter permease [Myxococcales bacterium]
MVNGHRDNSTPSTVPGVTSAHVSVWRRLRQAGLLALVMLPLAAALGTLVGSSGADPALLRQAFNFPQSTAATIVFQVRLPAVLLSFLAGALLATSGAAMQGLVRNPLADPYILGISGGAALGAAFSLLLAPPQWAGWLTPLLACAGALGTTLLVASLAAATRERAQSPVGHNLLLAGVMVNTIAGALLLLGASLADPIRARTVQLWMMGTIDATRLTASTWLVLIGVGLPAALWLLTKSHQFNLLALGDSEAQSLGLQTTTFRRHSLLVITLCTGFTVAATGLIGFVGLVVPHLIRTAVHADHRVVVLLSPVYGALFLSLADTTARGLYNVAGSSIPVGVVTALMGAPLFLWLLVKRGAGT